MSTNDNLFEKNGQSKRNRAEALLLTSLTPYRWAIPAHRQKQRAATEPSGDDTNDRHPSRHNGRYNTFAIPSSHIIALAKSYSRQALAAVIAAPGNCIGNLQDCFARLISTPVDGPSPRSPPARRSPIQAQCRTCSCRSTELAVAAA